MVSAGLMDYTLLDNSIKRVLDTGILIITNIFVVIETILILLGSPWCPLLTILLLYWNHKKSYKKLLKRLSQDLL